MNTFQPSYTMSALVLVLTETDSHLSSQLDHDCALD